MELFKKDKFCPRCGTKDVWSRLKDDGFYVGKEHLCASCDYLFTVQDIGPPYAGWKDSLAKLKEMKQ